MLSLSHESMPRRRSNVLLWSFLALAVCVVAGVLWLLTVPARLESWLQERVLLALHEHYQVEVKLENLHVTLIPAFRATADNFILPNRAGADLPPLITVQQLTIGAQLFQLLRTPVHVDWVKLEGLKIQVAHKHDVTVPPAAQTKRHLHLANFVIDRVEADQAQLIIFRKDPLKEPMEWDLHRLKLRSAGVGQPMKFQSELTNPTPPGVIHTSGRFGPWNFDEPGDTRVSGQYDFGHADLSVFNGISGILSSVGEYQGTLNNIDVNGTTDTPDFQLDKGGQPVHLTTKFHAVVDGTNGNTYLEPVNAHFLDTDIHVVKGKIEGEKGKKGKTISLEIDVPRGRLQDVLALASKSDKPMLTGALTLKANLLLAPGNVPVLHKMRIDGRFRVADAKFTEAQLNDALLKLSRRAQGHPDDLTIQEAPAEFAGDFLLQDGTLDFRKLDFALPGASARVMGSYALESGEIDFSGEVSLEARMSQTMTGAKRVVLVPLDPLFKKHGAGTYLPVSITGTRTEPKLHLDTKKLF